LPSWHIRVTTTATPAIKNIVVVEVKPVIAFPGLPTREPRLLPSRFGRHLLDIAQKFGKNRHEASSFARNCGGHRSGRRRTHREPQGSGRTIQRYLRGTAPTRHALPKLRSSISSALRHAPCAKSWLRRPAGGTRKSAAGRTGSISF